MSRNPYDPPKAEVGLDAPVAQQGDTFTKVGAVFMPRLIDLWRFYTLQQSRNTAAQLLFGGTPIALAWWAMQRRGCDASANCVAAGVVLAVILFTALVVLQLLFNVLALLARKNRSVYTEHRVELMPDGMCEETRYKRCLYLWPGIRKVVSGMGIVAVYLTAQTAVMIPKRAFASAEQREFFIRTIRSNLRAPTVD